ncbi:GPW/gp25 family protein [Flammeovirgaceae bacterium SG7u.111]|nr:GPW/gp25 family protein [Flammeovirgaceae bacterium SG7u.132]WPO36484.1 GPW/gp25 family protein [Flammeovirgaceae bacterium SG7u.111]
MDENSFLGRGWAFPPSFDPDSGAEMVANEEDIQQSLTILLSTSLRERVMQPEYGCDLNEFVFEPVNSSLRTYIADLVRNAILFHEPRIEVEKVRLYPGQELEGVIMISVDYQVRATNSRFNFVYPFYQKEGGENLL